MEETDKKLAVPKSKGDTRTNSLHISQALTTSEAGIQLHKSPPINVNLSGLEDDNFKHMLAYPKKLSCMFVTGFISLLGGSVAQFAVPGVIGLVVDQMNERKKWFKIAEDGTRTMIDAIDPKTKLAIVGSG